MRLFFLLVILTVIPFASSYGQVKEIFVQENGTTVIEGVPELKKSTALLITVLLGPVGGHRVIMGTKSWVPLVYTLTLGGGLGIVPLIDFFATLFSKDIKEYQNQGRVLMWLNKKGVPRGTP
ncbi:hypothetical protein [Luteibaculum oceani]|uniref:TM2 domain-containing protein n=1 Tax=Luteibaculum oceani TaxID=1294296 RepID=A0A5C6V2S7_9FLAO|nr:hypothetical protein [Luteibaculum oceani]TXC78971.1 hypothetical protein FRX97_07085 [Luteibaculum oceani]